MKIYLKKFVLGEVTLIFALACFALSPTARAVSPPPDGGYAGGNTAEGTSALFSLQAGGVRNTAIGFNALFSNTTGTDNTAIGWVALYTNVIGSFNTATGWGALSANTVDNNTATGYNALVVNTTGTQNTANGANALKTNTIGSKNTAIGFDALFKNLSSVPTEATQNTAIGNFALFSNTTGHENTATGADALANYSASSNNTATGFEALFGSSTISLNTGHENTANGAFALVNNTAGYNNTAIGFDALFNITTGFNNIGVGFQAGSSQTTGNNNIDIGANGAVESGIIRIGTAPTQTDTYIAGIYLRPVFGNAPIVHVDSTGKLGTVAGSSARFKEAIKPMDRASETILALQPVTFRYKKEFDPEKIPQFGLVAEQVEKVNRDLVEYDPQGKPYGVRYEAVNAMLLNEFLKEHAKVEQLKKNFESKIAEQQKQIEALTAGLQKVSDRLEASKPEQQMVAKSESR